VEEEEDEERGSRGQHHRHLRVLVAVGWTVQSRHWNNCKLK
jgi:hypothetical protein